MLSCAADVSVDEIFDACLGAYSPRTVNGYRSDLRVFTNWCASRHYAWLPAASSAIAEFVESQVEEHCVSTIKRQALCDRLCAPDERATGAH